LNQHPVANLYNTCLSWLGRRVSEDESVGNVASSAVACDAPCGMGIRVHKSLLNMVLLYQLPERNPEKPTLATIA
jgi:hypothetical protein